MKATRLNRTVLPTPCAPGTPDRILLRYPSATGGIARPRMRGAAGASLGKDRGKPFLAEGRGEGPSRSTMTAIRLEVPKSKSGSSNWRQKNFRMDFSGFTSLAISIFRENSG